MTIIENLMVLLVVFLMTVILHMFFLSFHNNWSFYFSAEHFFNVSTSENIMWIDRLIFQYELNILEIGVKQVREKLKGRISLRLVHRLNSDENCGGKSFDHDNRFVEKLFGFGIGKFFKENNFRIGLWVRIV